jgi:arsenate reductase/regulatory protein spx
VEFTERDFFKEPLSAKELDALIGKRPASGFFSKKSPSVKKMGLNVETLSDAEMKRLMLEEPRLLRRPVLKVGRKILVGFTAAEWEASLASA